jgi:hypothetical protein
MLHDWAAEGWEEASEDGCVHHYTRKLAEQVEHAHAGLIGLACCD